MILIFPVNSVLCARMGLCCYKEIALGYSKSNTVITPKLFQTNTVMIYREILFMSCAICFHLLTGAFQSRVRKVKHTQAAGGHSQKRSIHPGKKELLHCEREPPVVFQLAFSGQLKAEITLPLCFRCCDLMAKWIFSTKHYFLLWFQPSLNRKAP